LVVLGLPVAVLAGLGIDTLVSGPVGRRRAVASLSAGLVLALLVALDPRPHNLALFATAVVGGLLLEGIEIFPTRPKADSARARTHSGLSQPVRRTGVVLLVLALAVDTGRAIKPWVATAPEGEISRLAPGLALPHDLSNSFRIAELNRDIVKPGIPSLARRHYGLETLTGYNPLIPWRFVMYACHASGYSPFAHNTGETVLILHGRPKLFDLLGVTHLLHEPDRPGGSWQWQRSATALPRAYLVPGPTTVPVGTGEDLLRREMNALTLLENIDPRKQVLLHGAQAAKTLEEVGAVPGVQLEPYRPVPLRTRTANQTTIELRTERPGILVLNQPFFSGWHAWDHDVEVPLLRANSLFSALPLAAGEHSIVLDFRPISWRLGWWISLVAASVTVALPLLGLATRRRSPIATHASGPARPSIPEV
jgi:hypothetical protein